MKEKQIRDQIENGGMKDIKDVVIGSAIRYIDNWAFNDCQNIKKLVIGENVEEIGERAFGGRCNIPEEITVHSRSTHFYMEDNCLIETKTGGLKLCIGTPRISDSVRCVEFNYAFNPTFQSVSPNS